MMVHVKHGDGSSVSLCSYQQQKSKIPLHQISFFVWVHLTEKYNALKKPK
jgi:hypothetical protein